MDRELWKLLSQGMFDVARSFPKIPKQTYSTHDIVRIYLWSVLYDRLVQSQLFQRVNQEFDDAQGRWRKVWTVEAAKKKG
jgi:adenine/guanine phosphoribosyltransferase-like PRPP-binding protein